MFNILNKKDPIKIVTVGVIFLGSFLIFLFSPLGFVSANTTPPANNSWDTQNFDTTTLLKDQTGFWINSSGVYSDCLKSASYDHNGTGSTPRGVNIAYTSAKNCEFYYNGDYTAPIVMKLRNTFDFYIATATSTDADVAFNYDYETYAGGYVSLRFRLRYSVANGWRVSIQPYSGVAPLDVETFLEQDITPLEWHTFSVIYYNTTGLLDFRLDSRPAITDLNVLSSNPLLDTPAEFKISRIHVQNSSTVVSVYFDNMVFSDSLPASVAFTFPQNGYVISNSEWNDWSLSINYGEFLPDFARALIYSEDSLGYNSVDRDYLSVATSTFNWTINRSTDFASGTVSSYAIVQTAVASSTCVYQSSSGCQWSTIATSDVLTFTSSSTGMTVFDYGTTGFLPGTSTVTSFVFGTEDMHAKACSDAEWASGDWWTNMVCQSKYAFYTVANTAITAGNDAIQYSIGIVKYVFPFSIAVSIKDAWDSSETASIPDDLSFLNIIDENGDIYIDIPFQESASSTKIFGTTLFVGQNTASDTWYSHMRVFSKYLLYLIFIVGLIYRGYVLYDESS